MRACAHIRTSRARAHAQSAAGPAGVDLRNLNVWDIRSAHAPLTSRVDAELVEAQNRAAEALAGERGGRHGLRPE